MTDIAGLLDATWPAARTSRHGIWTLRDGKGGGKRVSAATTDARISSADLDQLEAAMPIPLVAVYAKQDDLDAALAARGYAIVDPTLFYRVPVTRLTDPPPPPVTGFSVWPPLQAQRDIWAEGGIGKDRVAVMERAPALKTSLLGRAADQAAAAAFVACIDRTAMIHAIEVRPALRRNGAAGHLIRHAARWAARHGATDLTLLVTQANGPARALYASLGMSRAAGYHYRMKPKEPS